MCIETTEGLHLREQFLDSTRKIGYTEVEDTCTTITESLSLSNAFFDGKVEFPVCGSRGYLHDEHGETRDLGHLSQQYGSDPGIPKHMACAQSLGDGSLRTSFYARLSLSTV